jgi:hypothetical protein
MANARVMGDGDTGVEQPGEQRGQAPRDPRVGDDEAEAQPE